MEQFPEVNLKLEEGSTIEIGGATISVEPLFEGVWRYSVRRGFEESSRILIFEDGGKIVTFPAYLDLPVLLKFETPVEIGPKNRKVFFLSLPLQIEILVKTQREEMKIDQITPPSLKKAWYGQPDQGDLSYYFLSPVYYSFEKAERRTGEAILPVRVRNLDGETHTLEKLMVDSYQLSLYEKNETLVTEVIEVVFLDGEAEIDYTDEAPFDDAREIVKGEESAKRKGLSKITRRRLKKFTQELFGGG